MLGVKAPGVEAEVFHTAEGNQTLLFWSWGSPDFEVSQLVTADTPCSGVPQLILRLSLTTWCSPCEYVP